MAPPGAAVAAPPGPGRCGREEPFPTAVPGGAGRGAGCGGCAVPPPPFPPRVTRARGSASRVGAPGVGCGGSAPPGAPRSPLGAFRPTGAARCRRFPPPPPLRAGPFVVRPRIMNGRAERREGARGAEGAWPKAAWAEESGRPRPHFATWGSEPLLPLAEPADVGEPCGRGLVGTAGGAGVNEGEAPPPGRCYIGAAPAPRPPGARRAVRGAAGSAGPAPGAAPPSSRTAPLRTPPDSTRPDPTRAGIYYSHSGGGEGRISISIP